MHKIWEEIHSVWDAFNRGPVKHEEWERIEEIDGLMSGLTPENIQESVFHLRGHEEWNRMGLTASTYLVAAFVAGIRVGNELHRRREK